MIKLRNITKQYPTEPLPTLDGLDLEISADDLIGLYGASGSGKSTLLRILGLFDFDYEGELHFDGSKIDVENHAMITTIRREKIGFIFQDFKLISDKTVKENLEWVCILSKIPKKHIKRSINRAFFRVSLSQNMLDKYPHQLSGGQQQRVAIARTLLKSPQFIIADEPTGALDQSTKSEILSLIKSLKIPCIIATHDLETQPYCTRILYIHSGKLHDTHKDKAP
ncbi:hypothetical protein AOC36_00285 [Erysipelothrix larvae]|uniref:ABC transporter domain-containing protein n=1 Tax=Erysipelothrix larvae TaxID=1514105 RepID=A0A0X8GXZ5_9FIRM|nr:ABC transporter ATP-binding protein [Erysipelothrix larvae]AMC92484.1 hypothetical protein AOC36_00285 [Erysipelothrix larvae]